MESIEAIKGAQFNFLSFLWKQISDIRELQKMGMYHIALVQALDLVDYLPKDFQEKLKFREKAQKTIRQIEKIHSNVEGVDAYTHLMDSEDSLNTHAKVALKEFMADLCMNLDAKGYMEKKPSPIDHGRE